MREIVGETLAKRLIEWGVDTIFGLPGDGINGLMEGLRRHRERLTFVLVHHEEAAAFMACGYAKATRRLGVCAATSGPGAIHLLNGLYDAKLDHVPVLAITGMQATSVLGSQYQQDVQTTLLYQDVADYNLMVTNPQQLPGVVDIAIRHALARRTVVHLSLPNDVAVAAASARPYRQLHPGAPPIGSPVQSHSPLPPAREDLERAASVRVTRWWPSRTYWPRRSSKRCPVSRSYPTITPSSPVDWGCSVPGPARRRWRSVTRC